MPSPIPLLSVPNVSEGRDLSTIEAIGKAFVSQGSVRLLDVHSDADHHRSVYTLVGEPGALAQGLLAGAEAALELIDLSGRVPSDVGLHPHVGAVDVVPLVHLNLAARGAAAAEALVAADLFGQRLQLPVFLYGALAQGRSRAALRAGGAKGLAERLSSGKINQDFGPPRMHRTVGASLVGARSPLVAFNLELIEGESVGTAKRIAALIREGGEEGLDGVRAIGLGLKGGEIAQVSCNVERPEQFGLRVVIEAVRKHAEVSRAELVGLAPRVAFEGFPDDIPIPGFDPQRHIIENALGF